MDNEELQVEEVDGGSSSFDVDTFIRYQNTPHPFLNFSW
jgi:hypothetical protein